MYRTNYIPLLWHLQQSKSFDLRSSILLFILMFCILLLILYRDYWKNRLSQQLFKVFIYTYILPLHVSAFAGHLQAEYTIFWEVISLTTDPLYFCYKSYLYMFLAILPSSI
jgi:hypothetical protein